AIEIRQNKYLNNLVEQDHRAVKRIVRPMLGFKGFHSARTTLRGIELLHMIKKGQMIMAEGTNLSAAGQFYSLAA
ncbi:MAG: DDE-type integrase/transposase/recombinase, partial [Candidatus Competibacteraceae bacterium]|nr:DDE-type integrase/transposase/recombinase [Candidatus Competibacteraceae bacterium]